MEFSKLMRIVADEPLFESAWLLAGDVDPADVRRQLSRWKKAGKIFQLRRGLYSLAPPFQKTRPHPFLVANRLVSTSCVSRESALAYYGLIPEYVPLTTSITTGRPARFDTALGSFDFRHLQPGLFFGLDYIDLGGQSAFLAAPEKALLDLIYLTPGGDSRAYLRELRLQNLDRLDPEALNEAGRRFARPKIGRAVGVILELRREAEGYTRL